MNAKTPPDLAGQIGTIHFTRLPVFDEENPRENSTLFRWANKFHITTREDVIANQVLFSSEEPYDKRLLTETSRLLRGQGYLFDAHARVVSRCKDQIDLEVITRDVWSFTPDASYERLGGENTYRFAIRETNLLGSGIELLALTKKSTDRHSNEFAFKTNHFRGSRIKVRASFADNDDGSEQFLLVSQPFYALDTRSAWSIRADQFERIDSQYFRGEEITEVENHSKDFLISRGFSHGLVNGNVRRWTFGYRYLDQRFVATRNPAPESFPTNRRLSYPFVQFHATDDNFATAYNLDHIRRTEDLHLGNNLLLEFGYAPEQLGSDKDRFTYRGIWQDTLLYDGRRLIQHSLNVDGMWNLESNRSEDLVVQYELRSFHRQTKRRSFFARFNAIYTKNLNSNRQVLLGGETGARAFDNRFQTGDRRLLLSLEERMYTTLHLFNLIRVGWAIFLDVGRAWQPGVDDGLREDYLANFGLGLRLASSKSNVGRVVHVDLAFPLTNKNDPLVDSSQVSVNIKAGL